MLLHIHLLNESESNIVIKCTVQNKSFVWIVAFRSNYSASKDFEFITKIISTVRKTSVTRKQTIIQNQVDSSKDGR